MKKHRVFIRNMEAGNYLELFLVSALSHPLSASN